jgi:hypothetical protein
MVPVSSITIQFSQRQPSARDTKLSQLVVPSLWRIRHFSVTKMRIPPSEMRTYIQVSLPRHVGESREMQLMRDGDSLGRTVTVLGQNQVRLSPAWIVAIERIRTVQQDHDVAILL